MKAAQAGFTTPKRDISAPHGKGWSTLAFRGKVWIPLRGALQPPSVCVLQQTPPGMHRHALAEIPLRKW